MRVPSSNGARLNARAHLRIVCGTAGAEMIGGTNEITLPVEGQTGTSPREAALQGVLYDSREGSSENHTGHSWTCR